jgi:hypothetical protein
MAGDTSRGGRSIKRLFATIAAAIALAIGGAHATPAPAADPTAAAKSCSAGYVHAVLSWGEKCLRAGQFCKVGNREYLKYGFYCPPSRHLRRR